MKTKIFLNARRLMLAGLAILTICTTNVWGETVSWTYSSDGIGSKSPINVTYGIGSAANNTTVSNGTLRLYPKRTDPNAGNGSWIKFTAGDGYEITAVSVTAADNQSYARYGVDAANEGSALTSSFSYSSGTASVSSLHATTFTIKNGQNSGSSNKTLQFSSITITYAATASKTNITVSAATPAKEVTIYGSNSLDLSTAFTVSPASSGTRTYEIISGGTGTGTIVGSTFSGTSAGTVNVRLTVAETNDYNSGNGPATITVNAASDRTVTWHVEDGSSTTSVTPGSQATPPADPVSSCDGIFVGWVATGDGVIGDKPSDANTSGPTTTIYTSSNKPTITCDGNVDFYAVFKKQGN